MRKYSYVRCSDAPGKVTGTGSLNVHTRHALAADKIRYTWLNGLVSLILLFSTHAQADLRTSPVWYDQNAVGVAPDWHYRVPINVPAGATVNSTIVVDVDFAALLAQMGVAGTFDVNSPRVVRSTGALATLQEFTDTVYANATDAAANARGEMRFILQDAGAVTYYLYFDINANGAKPANPQTPINGNFERGGTGTEDPPGWTATKTNGNFDAQIRPSETPTITTNAVGGAANAPLPASLATDGTPNTGAFSYLLGARTNNEPSDANPAVTLNKTLTVPASATGNMTVRYRIEGWDSSTNGSTNFDFLRIQLIGGTTTELVGPTVGNYVAFPFSPNLGLNPATTTTSGYRIYNGWDTDTTGTHRAGMTIAPGSEPWFTRTVSLAAYAGQTITLRFTSRHTTLYKSWIHIDDIEWSRVDATLGTPQGFGVNITAPSDTAVTTASIYSAGQILLIQAVVDASATSVTADVVNQLGAVVAAGVILYNDGTHGDATANDNIWTNDGALAASPTYTFLSGDPVGSNWFVIVYAKDGSTSAVGAPNGLIHIPGPPYTPISEANYYNVDEQIFTFQGTIGGFNAYDAPPPVIPAVTPIMRPITTKLVGTAFSLAIIAINTAKTAIDTSYNGQTIIELRDASGGGAVDANNCNALWPLIQTQNINFTGPGQGRVTVTFTTPNSYPDVRVRVRNNSGNRVGCSTDNFAIRPTGFTNVSATDATWQTAGTTNTLSTNTAAGGPIHKAGRPFTLRATAAPVGTTNYTGSPAFTLLTDCGGATACAPSFGTLATGAWGPNPGPGASGSVITNTASYDEVGAFNLQLQDHTFANVDVADTPATCSNVAPIGRYICQATAVPVGRFVPDHFTVSYNTPQFGTACGTTFTYVGQPFNYVTAPVITVTARNFAGGITTNYAGVDLWRLTNANLTYPAGNKGYAAAIGTVDTGLVPAIDPVIAQTAPGIGTLSFSSGTGIAFQRGAPVAQFDADISLRINIIDADAITYASNPANFGTASAGNGIAFNNANTKLMRYGRLRMNNAYGSNLLALPVPLVSEYATSSNSFALNTLDSCTTVPVPVSGSGLTYVGTGTTTASLNAPFVNGNGGLVLTAPGNGNSGYADIDINSPAWLDFDWLVATPGLENPRARATFTQYKKASQFIYMREN